MLQVLESVWAVIRGNMSLIMSILTSTLSIVFGGGTAILNFVVSAVSQLTSRWWTLWLSIPDSVIKQLWITLSQNMYGISVSVSLSLPLSLSLSLSLSLCLCPCLQISL